MSTIRNNCLGLRIKKPISIQDGLFILILIAGAALRFYKYSEWSLTNDELSALNRLRFDTLADLITKGARTDGHPIGVQVFLYYWVQLFGNSVASVRFPFVITGIFSTLFAYLFSSRWFNKTTGLFVAASMSFLAYPLLYSQIARPYMPGLCFSMMAVWFWTKIIFPDETKNFARRKLNVFGYIVTSSLCMYTHYFSFLFVGMIGITGLFFLKKKEMRLYLMSGLIIGLLYLPSLEIFFHQLSFRGVGLWLAVPEKRFIWDYILYGLNGSLIVQSTFIGTVVISLIAYRKGIRFGKLRIIALLWFLFPFIIGYLYSVYVNPVLQYSVLLFSFPFLPVFVFSFFNEQYAKLNYLLLFLYCSILLYSTVCEKGFYHKKPFGVFKELAEDVGEWNSKYGAQNITRVININHPYYIDYYISQLSSGIFSYIFLSSNDKKYKANIIKKVRDSDTPYFLYARSNISSPEDMVNIIRRKYPVVKEHKEYFNSEVTLFVRSDVDPRPPLYTAIHDFEEIGKWGNDSLLLTKQEFHSPRHSIKINSVTEYSPTFEKKIHELSFEKNEKLDVSVWVFAKDTSLNAQLVISFENNGESYNWSSARVKDFILKPEEWSEVFISRTIPSSISSNDIIKIYLWNPDKKEWYADDFSVTIFLKENTLE